MKKKNRKQKPILYEGYLREQADRKEREATGESLGLNPDQVVIKKFSKFDKFMMAVAAILRFIFRSVLIIVLMGLASIGLTVLVNASLRTVFLDFLTNLL